MILEKYTELNKTVAQIVAASPNGSKANCYYGNRCKPFYMPINSTYVSEMYWYIQAEKEIKTFSIKAVDCEGNITIHLPQLHITGKDGDGNYYGVINGLKTMPSATLFQLWVEVTYMDDSIRSFFAQEYEIVKCDAIDMLYSCYTKDDNGGYDINGAWIGMANDAKPIDSSSGHVELRYFNNYLVRDLKVLYSGSEITYTSFNNRPVKAERIRTYTIYTEVMPYWFEEKVASAFAKGYVYIDGSYYSISGYSSSPVGDPCCERLTLDIAATKVDTVGMSCSKTCDFDPVLLPDCSLGTLTYTTYPSDDDCGLGSLISQTICIDC